MNWTRALIVDQLEFYWDNHLWPRLEGLTDEEYYWEPVAGAWSVRPDATGVMRVDEGEAEPPITTIAWRIMHITVGCFFIRASTFFGDGSVPADADMFDPRHQPAELPATAAGALELLESSYRWWHDGVLSLDEEQLVAPLGPRGSWFAEDPMANLVLHINREVMHHGGEIGLMRDLYRIRPAAV